MSASTTAAPELEFLGARTRILDGSDELGLVDMIEVPARDQSPLHVHHTHDEGFYVLAGEVTLFTPGRAVTLGPGDFLLAPRGIPHAYEVGDAPARWLVTSTPAGFERFVAEVSALDAVDPAILAQVAAAHDIEILGPPGARP
ncbi:MAG TPA: cupin domain-containing protein [Capillimicrobium sp.]|nr:cupin domain-containing protein [Capillimicrobium sp.]